VEPKRTSKPGLNSLLAPKGAKGAVSVPGAAGTPAAAQTRRAGAGLSETLDQLGVDIRKLQIDFERFFNGGLHLPPEELRTRIQNQIRALRFLTITTSVDNFRLGDLEARFNSYNELFNRRVRDREEGRHVLARPVVVERPRYDPEAGIVFGATVDPAAVEALYQGLAGRGEGPKFDLDSFQTYLARQAAALREKTGCNEVQFRLANEDGKLKLKARPVPAKSPQK
jgi:hypothetical protein